VAFPDGVLIVDKPAGPTSHDIVAVARRASERVGRSVTADGKSTIDDGRSTMDDRRSTIDDRRPTKVGHTGTLDPLASGVLPLVLGRATRLAQFLSSAEKEYEAEIRLGVSTTTYDRAGEIIERTPARAVSDVTDAELRDAVAGFRGAQMQQPPSFSAKKIGGDRAYDLARRNAPVVLQPSPVVAHTLEIVSWDGERLRIRLVCSAGFYVRSLAQGLGDRLGTGAHLSGLVRTRSGDFSLESAISLAELEQNPELAAEKVIPLNRLLPRLPALTLTPTGATLAAKGGFISPAHLDRPQAALPLGKVRLLHPDGHLVAIAEERLAGPVGFLHPGVVLE
jgi:tRNA pseudouridine55 synthase